MRYILLAITMTGLSAPAMAAHFTNEDPPGQAAKDGADSNGDGRTNGADYAPGKISNEAAAPDRNGDGKTNGKDFAPGQ